MPLVQFRAAAAAAALFALLAVPSSPAHPSGTASPLKGCLTPPRAIVKTIKGTLTPTTRTRFAHAAAVKSAARFSMPPGLRGGIYFVSARVRGFGVASWAVATHAYRTGSDGLIIGVGPVARRVSTAGFDIPPRMLSRWRLTVRTLGYAASRRCVR